MLFVTDDNYTRGWSTDKLPMTVKGFSQRRGGTECTRRKRQVMKQSKIRVKAQSRDLPCDYAYCFIRRRSRMPINSKMTAAIGEMKAMITIANPSRM